MRCKLINKFCMGVRKYLYSIHILKADLHQVNLRFVSPTKILVLIFYLKKVIVSSEILITC